MLKKVLTSFRTQSVRSLLGFYRRRAHYLDNKRLEVSRFPLCFGEIKPTVLASRNYVQNRGGKEGKEVEINEKELAEAFDIDELKEDFIGPLENFKALLNRQTRPKPESESIKNFEFEFDGKMQKIYDLAHVGKKSPTRFVLHFDGAPKAIPELVKAIRSSDLNWNIQLEGTKVHVQTPKKVMDLTPYIKKTCKGHLHACREELMIVQGKYLQKLSKQDALSLELRFKLQDQLKALTENLLIEADNLLEQKLAELQKEGD